MDLTAPRREEDREGGTDRLYGVGITRKEGTEAL